MALFAKRLLDITTDSSFLEEDGLKLVKQTSSKESKPYNY
jgi:hypothetical protein